jgi:hypothetical protein
MENNVVNEIREFLSKKKLSVEEQMFALKLAYDNLQMATAQEELLDRLEGKEVYEIWSEAWFGGVEGKPILHGTQKAPSFKRACLQLAKSDFGFKSAFDAATLTYQGKPLYRSKELV